MSSDPEPRAPAESDQLAYLSLLEGRRLSYDSGLWQVPALIVAGQAFLLNVLTKPTVKGADAWVIAAAGVVASLAAILALWVQRSREREFSGRVRDRWKERHMPDPNRQGAGGHPKVGWLVSGAMVWSVVQGAFIAADVWVVNGAADCTKVIVLASVVGVVVLLSLGVWVRDRLRGRAEAQVDAEGPDDAEQHEPTSAPTP